MQNNGKNNKQKPKRPLNSKKPVSSENMLSEKTKLMDISEVKNGKKKTSKSTASGKKFKKSKLAAKITAKSSLFFLRKILTYLLNIILTAMLVGVITGAVVGLAFIVYIKNYIDPEYTGLDNLKFDSALSTSLFYEDKNGNEIELEEDRLHGSENRLWAEYKTIPQNLVDAYVAVEDQRFFTHDGVDLKRTASAIYNFFIPTSASYGGGSTITQQLIKNVTGENEVTIQRKVQEIFRAFNVEEQFSKQEILEMYLNTIYLSQNTNGVRAAAETYFGKDLSELTLVECAAIAAIGKSPIRYDPIINPKNNLQRRNLVLKLMLEQEKISQEEFNESYDAPLILTRDENSEYTETIHSYYIDTVLDDAIEAIKEKYECDNTTASRMLYSGGLQIVTCLNPTVQNIVEEVFSDDNYPSKTTGIQAQAAMCVIDPESGDLIGIVGGRGEKKLSRGFNRATQSKRQCGSAIKPLSVYTLAIDMGIYTYAGPVDDVPTVYFESSNKYWPTNANRTYSGSVSLEYAVKRSLNTVAVSTAQKVGIDKIFDKMTKEMGFTTLVESEKIKDTTYSDKQLAPLALGSFTHGVTVREMTQAYNIIANGGIFSKARTFTKIRNNKGNTIIENKSEKKPVFADTSTYIMTSLLKHVVKSGGTAGNSVKFDSKYPDVEVAGKTGSTNDNKDQYFCGYTPDYVACCWYGYDNNKTIVARGNPAAKLWDAVMQKIYEYLIKNKIEYNKEFYTPPTIVKNVPYCTVSGKKPTEACGKDLKSKKACIARGVFTKSTVPTEPCDRHIMVKYDTVTKAICVEGCDCPEENLIDVSFRLMPDRQFVRQVRISDAQYAYRPVPEGYIYPTGDVPFFQNILGEGVFVGTSGSGKPCNRICSEHYHPEQTDTDDESDDTSDDVSYIEYID